MDPKPSGITVIRELIHIRFLIVLSELDMKDQRQNNVLVK